MATAISGPPILPENAGGSANEVKVINLGRQPLRSLLSHLGAVAVAVALPPPQQNIGVFWVLKRRRKRSTLRDSGMVPLMLVLAMLKSERPVASLHHHQGRAGGPGLDRRPGGCLARGVKGGARARQAGCTTVPHSGQLLACAAPRTPCLPAACRSGSC
jgi:hypothetical protein